MDIAIVANEPAPYRMAVIRRLTKELQGVRTHALFTCDPNQLSQSWDGDITAGTNSTFFPQYATSANKRSLPRQIKLYQAIRNKLIENNVKLVLLHGYNDLTRYLLLRWCNKHNIKVALTSDSNILKEGRLSTAKATIKRLYLRHVIQRLDALMPCGTAGEMYYRSYLDHDLPCIIFPFEPDYSAFNCSQNQVEQHLKGHGLDPNKRHILFCGRLISLKRVDMLVQAFAAIESDRKNWDLIIIGEGPEKERIKALIPQEMSSRIHWVGFSQGQELARWYKSSDLLALPSDHDAWGLVVNEALAAGLAVITTNVVGASVDLIHEGVNGYTYPPRDLDMLTARLHQATTENHIDHLKKKSTNVLTNWQATHCSVHAVEQMIEKLQIQNDHPTHS